MKASSRNTPNTGVITIEDVGNEECSPLRVSNDFPPGFQSLVTSPSSGHVNQQTRALDHGARPSRPHIGPGEHRKNRPQTHKVT